MHMQIDLDNLKCLSPGLHCLLQLLLGPPSQGPGVHVPPPTTITTVQYLLQKAPEKSADSRRMANLRRSRRLEPEEGDPIWRTTESHTRLVLVQGARRRLQIDTDPPRLRLIYNQNMQNMQNMHNMTSAWHGNQNENEHNMHNMHNIYNMHNITNMSLYEQYVKYD